LQVWGEEAFGSVLEASFSDDLDRILMDLRQAYRVEGLLLMTREFSYHRSAVSRIEVIDSFEFSEPSVFETAMITYGQWKLHADGSLTISSNGRSIHVTVATDDGRLIFGSDVIQESSKPNRLAWRLAKPTSAGRITTSISTQEPSTKSL
jgi:hypothetical protein